MLIQAQVDAGPPHGWVTVGEWTHPAPGRLTSKSRTALVRQICADHGWEILDDATVDDDVKDTISVLVRPTQWRHLLTEVTNRRAAQKAAYEAADLAWQTVVADTPRQGETGYVGAIEIANVAGMTRHRIYQIQGVGKKPGLKHAPTAADDPD